MDNKETFDIGSENEFRLVSVPIGDDKQSNDKLAEINADKTWDFKSATSIEVYGEPYVVYLFVRNSIALPLS
jgi:hypothetical protein